MLWLKAFHIVFMVTWFAGLFYLPRLFVYHAMSEDAASLERFKVMERKLYYGIMTPGAVLTVATGLGLWLYYGISGGWLHAKLALVAALIGYHVWCGRLLAALREGRNTHSHVWYRWFNEAPVLLLIAIVVLVTVKPAFAGAAEGASARIVVQHAPLAGFVYYDGAAVWERMKKGDRLTLTREPSNPHDANAVRLEWQGRMLGYVPRRDNTDLARQMDHGARPVAMITDLAKAANGRHRISYEISIPLK